jgi:hypothetical protein
VIPKICCHRLDTKNSNTFMIVTKNFHHLFTNLARFATSFREIELKLFSNLALHRVVKILGEFKKFYQKIDMNPATLDLNMLFCLEGD